MDLKELFLTPEFGSYQDELVSAVSGWLYDATMINPRSGDEIKAAVDISRQLLTLPKRLVRNDDFSKRLDAKIQARLSAIPVQLLRRAMISE